MGFLWGLLMWFFSHWFINGAAHNIYYIVMEKKMPEQSAAALKRYLRRAVFYVVLEIATLAIGLCVKPFADHRIGIIIGFLVACVTVSIHLRITGEKNFAHDKVHGLMHGEYRLTADGSESDAFADNTNKARGGDRPSATVKENISYNDGEVRNKNMIRNMLGEEVNEESFAFMQQILPGFGTQDFLSRDRYEQIKASVARQESVEYDDICLYLLAHIFGTYGCEIDRDLVIEQARNIANEVLRFKPASPPARSNKEYMYWLHIYAKPLVLLGTAYAYKGEYIKGAYYLMQALKTEQIVLNMPYCDFMRYVFDKLKEYDAEQAEYTGCGFSADNPMGSYYGGDMLIADYAQRIIPELEGKNGEVIIAKIGRAGMYGSVVRRGSVSSAATRNMIDIYETYVIDGDFNLKKVRFYFNGYFSRNNTVVRLPDGFDIKQHSQLCDVFRFRH